MSDVSSKRKRKWPEESPASEPQRKFANVTLVNPSLLLLEIPPDVNTSLPVWEAVTSQQAEVTWTINPYSISVHFTPVTTQRDKSRSRSVVAPTWASFPNTSQEASQVWLTFSETGPPDSLHPNPTSSTSLAFSLPVPIANLQQPAHLPVAMVKTSVPPAAKDTILSKVQAPEDAAALSQLHTKTSEDVYICNSFLLGTCRLGETCEMHHTRYPFHWQLRSVKTSRWTDINPRSQVLLERLYCDVNREKISLQEGNVYYSLNFDTMELDDPSKYDGVRRLTNSESLSGNPYFPSKWKIYWWNIIDWEEYEQCLSDWLLKNMREKEPHCFFFIGSEKYKVDFTTMTQTNVSTLFKRAVRCRPVYRSPDSMQPHLQTGIQTQYMEQASNFNVDPLEAFSSWYPPAWYRASGLDYRLVLVPSGTQVYRSVRDFFYETLPETQVEVVSILQVQNILHWDKYQRHKIHMQKQHRSAEPLERHLFHGTTRAASKSICHNNFDPRMAGVHGRAYGFGSYFATKASLSNSFTSEWGSENIRHMFLAKVLVGNVSLGGKHHRRPPPLHPKTRYRLYDACVDNVHRPTMFVVFDSCQCYPYYLIKYKDLPNNIEV